MRDNAATARKKDWLHDVGDQVDLTVVPTLLLQHPTAARLSSPLKELDGIGLVTDRFLDGYYGEGRPMRYYEDEIYVMLVDGKIHHVHGDILRWIVRHSPK